MDFVVVGFGLGGLSVLLGLGLRDLMPWFWRVRAERERIPSEVARRVARGRGSRAGGLVVALSGGAICFVTLLLLLAGVGDRTGLLIVSATVTFGALTAAGWLYAYIRFAHPDLLAGSGSRRTAAYPDPLAFDDHAEEQRAAPVVLLEPFQSERSRPPDMASTPEINEQPAVPSLAPAPIAAEATVDAVAVAADDVDVKVIDGAEGTVDEPPADAEEGTSSVPAIQVDSAIADVDSPAELADEAKDSPADDHAPAQADGTASAVELSLDSASLPAPGPAGLNGTEGDEAAPIPVAAGPVAGDPA